MKINNLIQLNININKDNMSQHYLGAINKDTNEYENIFHANKPNQYKCIGCANDLILRKGQTKFQSFVHKNGNPCDYFKNASQVQILHDAKLFLRWMIINNQVELFGSCKICMGRCKIDLPIYDQTKSLVIDHGVGEELMDLVYLGPDNNIICGFEIYYDAPVKQAEYELYQIYVMQINYQIIRNFATQKIEILTRKRSYCPNCVQYA